MRHTYAVSGPTGRVSWNQRIRRCVCHNGAPIPGSLFQKNHNAKATHQWRKEGKRDKQTAWKVQCITPMDSVTAIAASGLRSRSQELDCIAVNLSNVNTSGYKGHRYDNETYLLRADPSLAVTGGIERSSAAGHHRLDFDAGALIDSGSPNDLAVRGEGFFVLRSDSGEFLGRGGKLAILPGGELATQNGQAYLGVDGKPLRLDPMKPFAIDRTGNVVQDARLIGTLLVVSADQGSDLLRTAAGTFSLSGRAGSLAKSNAQVIQGALEQSNVNPAQESIRLVRVMREFESMQRALQMSGEMSRSTFDHVAKV